MIYIDMDGTLAKWNTAASPEDTHRAGYFRNIAPEEKMKQLIFLLLENGYEVAILSAAYVNGTAKADKRYWLFRNGLSGIPRIFVPYGADKNRFVAADPGNILIDDYTENLRAWEAAGYIPVKFYNGINGTRGTYRGLSIDRRMTPEEMYGIVSSAADAARKTA